MKKSPLARKLGALALAVILLLSSLLTSCGESLEEMQDKAIVLRVSYGDPFVFYPRVPHSSIPSSDYRNDPIKETFDTYTYRGVEYKGAHTWTIYNKTIYPKDEFTLNTWESTPFSREKCYQFAAISDDGSRFLIRYTDEWKLPILLVRDDQAIYGEGLENPSLEDVIQLCEDFVDDYINEKADFELDLSDYTCTSDFPLTKTFINGYYIGFERYVNGISVHGIRILFNKNYQITGYYIRSAPLDKKIYKQIPNLTEEEWAEITKSSIEKAYKSFEHDVTVTNIKSMYNLSTASVSDFLVELKDSYYLYYDNAIDAYNVCYWVSADVTFSDGTSKTEGVMCAYPIYTLPEE